MRRWFLIVASVLVGLFALLWVVGSFVPREHVAQSRATYHRPPEEVWTLITDHASAPSWRSELQRVERAPDRDGHPVWIEHSKFGPLTYEVEVSEPPHRYVTRIADPELPFGGTWTWEIEPVDGGARVSITENGFVRPALFRVVARFLFGYHATMDAYLEALGKELGEEVEPEHVPA
jgi:uncharacterized protein YndB with AHSA1/START domain